MNTTLLYAGPSPQMKDWGIAAVRAVVGRTWLVDRRLEAGLAPHREH